MRLVYDYWVGNFSEINNVLKRSISQYTRHYKKVKIGITCHPERRLKEHFNSILRWNYMVIKYRTSSIKFINKMEENLIDYQRDYVINKNRGGGGPNGKKGPYFLYLLLKK